MVRWSSQYTITSRMSALGVHASIPDDRQGREMELKLEQIGDITYAQVCEESIRADNAPEFRACLLALLKPESKIVLDMGSVKFMDSSGIGSLLSFIKRSQNTKDSLKLCNITRQVQNLFDLVRVNRFLNVFENREDAMKSFQK